MTMKVLISDAVETVCTEVLEKEGHTVVNRPGIKLPDLLKEIPEYDALIVRSGTQVTSEVIAAGSRLRVIGRAGAGVDNIDVDAATRRGILVMNTPGGNTVSTAEHTMSLLLSMARSIPQANQSLRDGKWERKKFVGTELFGKTIGVVGLGKVGREVALRCQAFGMRTIGYDPVLAGDVAARQNIELMTLDALFAQSDIITVHTPLNADTKNLVNRDSLQRCKKGVRVINCARGGIIDEEAILEALESGHVSGYAVDVFVTEPPGESQLVRHPHVVATPHLGASTDEAQEKVAKQIAEQLADVFAERGIAGAVNGESVRFVYKKELAPFVNLSERMGRLHGQLLSGNLKKLSISLRGEFPAGAPEAVGAAVRKGILSHLLAEPVNFINAPFLAREKGIRVEEKQEDRHPTYAHLITVAVESDRGSLTFSGTVFGPDLLRLVEIDGFGLEVVPEGHILLYKNVDKPGMLARVGSALAESRINIAGLSLGRDNPGKTALTVISVDSPIPEGLLTSLRALEGLSEVRTASL